MTIRAIELDRVIISSQEVFASSSDSCTVYVNEKRRPYYLVSDLMSRYNQIVRIAKQRGIKLSLLKKPLSMKRQIEALSQDYDSSMTTYNTLFDQLVGKWSNIAQNDFHTGIFDTPEYQSAVSISHQLTRMTARNKPIGQARTIHNELDECLKLVNHPNVTKVTL